VPLELVVGLEPQVLEQLGRELRHRRGEERLLAELDPRRAHARHVDGVGLVDAALDEDALAPAHHLAAHAQLERPRAQLPVALEVGVEQQQLRADHAALHQAVAVARARAQVGALGAVVAVADGVVEDVGAQEGAVVAPLHVELDQRLAAGRVEVPLVVVQVAIVPVQELRVAGGPAVADVDGVRVALGDAQRGADGEGGVEAHQRVALAIQLGSLGERGPAAGEAERQ
jgi:hypothetical protein